MRRMMNMAGAIALAIGILMPLQSSAAVPASGMFYATDFAYNSQNLLTVDPSTYAVTTVGPLGFSNNYGGLAFDTSTQTLYAVGGRGNQNLYTIDTTTGAGTLVGAHGITDLFCIAYDPTTDTLYGASANVNGTGGLYSLNRTTGAATLIGLTGIYNDGLAFDTKLGKLFSLTFGSTTGKMRLFEINTTTGAATLVGPTNLGSTDSGLAYDSVTDTLVSADLLGNISTIDPATGASTVVATAANSFVGFAFVAGPAASGVGGGGGCAMNPQASFDPMLGMLVLLAAGFLLRRRFVS